MVNILHYFFNVVNALYCTMVRLLVPQLLFTHNYIRQGFYSPVAIRKLAVTEFYPVFWSCGTPQARAPSSDSPRYLLYEKVTDKTFNSQ